jgi:hypothetical protein
MLCRLNNIVLMARGTRGRRLCFVCTRKRMVIKRNVAGRVREFAKSFFFFFFSSSKEECPRPDIASD